MQSIMRLVPPKSLNILWKDGWYSMMLLAGCSSTHQHALQAARMHKIMHLETMQLPSATFWLSLRPRGRHLERRVDPILLGGVLRSVGREGA